MRVWPRVSIVIPNYNQARFLGDALDSILAQGYPDVEIIVIDGASTDESAAILEEYGSSVSYWCSESDRGQSHALNKGFARATGEVFGWLNADDVYLPRSLWRAVEVLSHSTHARVVHGDYLFIDEGGQVLDRAATFPFRRWHFLFEDFHLNAQSMFWTSEAHRLVGLFDETLHRTMDYDFILRLSQAVGDEAFQWLPDALGAFRRHEGQKTEGVDEGVLREHKVIAEKAGLSVKYVPVISTLGWLGGRSRRAWWYAHRRGVLWAVRRGLHGRWRRHSSKASCSQ